MSDLIEIKSKIYTIRGVQVMLDRDLAKVYNVETRVLNQAVKRNLSRFPDYFMFQLSIAEVDNLRTIWRSQIVMTNKENKGFRRLPYVFSEQGIIMLSAVLKSEIAINVSIQIVKIFVQMRKFISDNTVLFDRLDTLEQKHLEYKLKSDKKFNKIFDSLKTNHPDKGIFFDGQMFDAYNFISDLIRSAKKDLILIDNYIDDTILTLFTKCNRGVSIQIYTKDITKKLELDLKKFNFQYNHLKITRFQNSHDRFLIIDKKEVYHLGASLKDLGKKWFAFSKFTGDSLITTKILEQLKK